MVFRHSYKTKTYFINMPGSRRSIIIIKPEIKKTVSIKQLLQDLNFVYISMIVIKGISDERKESFIEIVVFH